MLRAGKQQRLYLIFQSRFVNTEGEKSPSSAAHEKSTLKVRDITFPGPFNNQEKTLIASNTIFQSIFWKYTPRDRQISVLMALLYTQLQ